MTRTYTVGAHTFRFTLPPTYADVLYWTVWAQCIQGDSLEETAALSAQAAVEFACRYLVPEHTAADLDDILGGLEGNAFVHLVRLCNAIVAAAGLPAQVRDDIGTMLDRKNKVPDDFRADPVCRCARCTVERRGGNAEDVPDKGCVFGGLSPMAVGAAAHVSPDDDLSAPLYVVQLRRIYQRAESRRLQHERQEREEKARWEEKMRDRGLMRGSVH